MPKKREISTPATMADLRCQQIRDPGVTRDGFHGSIRGVGSERMGTAFPLEDAAVATEVLEESAPLHPA